MKKIVVIGGGYGGLRFIESMRDVEGVDITLLDINPYHYLQTEAYAYIAAKSDAYDIALDLKSWCDGFLNVRFEQMEACGIDFEKKVVLGAQSEIAYDYVVVAIGARTNFFSFIEGLREHSYGVKFLSKAYNFKKRFEEALYEKLTQGQKREPINIAIGGAGLSGVEVAAEMAFVIKEYRRTLGERAAEIQIHLIDASQTILPGSSNFVIKSTTKRLLKLGVNILTSAFISKVTKDTIHFKDGKELSHHFMIFTGGIKAAPLSEAISCEKNRLSQLIVDEMLNISEHKDAFAIGDCIEVRDKKGSLLPPTAQIAERSAEYVADALIARMQDREPKPFDASVMGVFVALGGKYAVGELFGFIKVSGYKAYLLKRAITYAYYLGLKLRINAGFKIRNAKI